MRRVMRCAYCNMRVHRCRCRPDRKKETRVPDLNTDKSQTRLDSVEENVFSRIRYWTRWLNTEGVRLGLWVHPEQHQSSQDRSQSTLRESESNEDGQLPES